MLLGSHWGPHAACRRACTRLTPCLALPACCLACLSPCLQACNVNGGPGTEITRDLALSAKDVLTTVAHIVVPPPYDLAAGQVVVAVLNIAYCIIKVRQAAGLEGGGQGVWWWWWGGWGAARTAFWGDCGRLQAMR